ncbi:hypothetical protein MHBO_002651 [Bonamia ostreae]|uniref:ABC transporter domain-containing protein n=1 Tax=Bonamia ostreae TaxID=126728 RepID=A0ABV2ANT1_9EUKA
MEVLNWGKDGIERFTAYLNFGKEPVYHTSGMIVGCAGAGKTTLINRLQDCSLGEILKVKTTKGIEVHPAIFKVNNKQLQGITM